MLSIDKCNMRRQIHLFPEEMTIWNKIIDWCEEFAWEGFFSLFFFLLGSNYILLEPNPESTLFSSTWSFFYLKLDLPYRQDWRVELVILKSVNLSESLDMFLWILCY